MESLSGEDGKIYALPFYGESSFLMYRKDVLEKKGLDHAREATWDQVADIAAKVDGAEPGMKGICLRGLPGWGEMFAPLTTVVNTFGGTWFEKDWTAQGQRQAVRRRDQLLRQPGQGARRARRGPGRLHRVPQRDEPGQGRHVVRRHVGRRFARGPEGQQGRRQGRLRLRPVKETDNAGWLWAWAWAMPKTTKKADAAAEFMTWASSKEYEELVGEKLGWARVPAGKRESTYENPDYKKAAAAFGATTLAAIEAANPTDPGVQPRPTVGVQFVAVPEFQDLGTKVSQDISAAIAGRGTVQEALDKGQQLGRGRHRGVPEVTAPNPEHRGGPSATPGAAHPGHQGPSPARQQGHPAPLSTDRQHHGGTS